MAIRAGKLRHLVTIQAPSETRDACGGEIPNGWTDFATVWASVEPLQGREYLAAAGVEARATTRIRIRYLAGVTAAMRVVFEDKVYQLVSPPIDPNKMHSELHLMTEETEQTVSEES